jgi:hypothetical protein
MKAFVCVLTLIITVENATARAAELPLNARSDLDSSYFEYFSNGFLRMDQFAPNNPMNQNFHDIDDPSINYNQNFDGFPNDRQFRFGSVQYDDSGLVGGTGSAPITGVTLNIVHDPANAAYINWRRFMANTIVDPSTLTGADVVEVVNGVPVSATMSVEVDLEVIGALGATMTGVYPGEFTLDGEQFSLLAEGDPVLDTVFGTGPFHLKWDFGGRLSAFPPEGGDYFQDGLVDGEDFLAWQRALGDAVMPGSGVDGDSSGAVDAGDLTVWRENFGYGSVAVGGPGAHSVPEPVAGSLIAGVALTTFAWRRRFANTDIER